MDSIIEFLSQIGPVLGIVIAAVWHITNKINKIDTKCEMMGQKLTMVEEVLNKQLSSIESGIKKNDSVIKQLDRKVLALEIKTEGKESETA